MKLSLAWIFDHIDADWKQQDAAEIVSLFNRITAEIEFFHKVSFDMQSFCMGQIIEKSQKTCHILVPELGQTIELPMRSDVDGNERFAFMIAKTGNTFQWAGRHHFGQDHNDFLPALNISIEHLNGSWRTLFEGEDVIFDVDNKSITHRPDMWGHRGFAREIAAFLKLPFKNKDLLLEKIPPVQFDHTTKATQSFPFVIENQASSVCERFAGLYMHSVDYRPSDVFIASRLLKVGARPLSLALDLGNYLMLDWGLPVHAYDADKINKKYVIARMAHDKEQLTLLDDVQLELTPQDLVIADSGKALCLAGVKGGLNSGVTSSTKSIFLEAATFDAGTIRRTAQCHKTRTEASARFEKSLDSTMIIEVLQRFVRLAKQYALPFQPSEHILVVGKERQATVIELTHDFLVQRSGVPLTHEQVTSLLARLDFGVLKTTDSMHGSHYVITVPSFRASKDIKIKEDILEEVIRCYGFDKIEPVLPAFHRSPFDFSQITRLEKLKQYLAFSAHMTEQQNYSMFDESALKSLGLELASPVYVVKPISENYARLVTSLVPGLLKNIKENHVHKDSVAFFECARIWTENNGEPVEKRSVAGIFFKKRVPIDFYYGKSIVNNMFRALGFSLSDIAWVKTSDDSTWMHPYQTAQIFYKGVPVGVAGKASTSILSKLGVDTACDAFIFQLDGEFLLTTKIDTPAHHHLIKYQETFFDLSMFIPLHLQTADLELALATAGPFIKRVELIDFFEKEGERSLAFRVWLVSEEKTLEKADIDGVMAEAIQIAQAKGATIRCGGQS